MTRTAQAYDTFTVVPIQTDGSQVLDDPDRMLDPMYAFYCSSVAVPGRLDPRPYAAATGAYMYDGHARPDRGERGQFWHNYMIGNARESIAALDGALPELSWHEYPGGDPRLLVEDLAGLISEYDGSHLGRISCLVMGRQPYHWCEPHLHLIPGCRLHGDERPFDPLHDVRIICSIMVGRAASSSVFAVNPSLAFRIRSPVTFATRYDPSRNAAVTRYEDSHQYVCTGESGFKVGLGGHAVP